MSDNDKAMGDATNAFQTAMTTATAHAKSMTEDIGKMFGGMKMPAMPDTEALLAAHKRNLETLTAANKVAMEGAQAVIKRNMEIMQQSMAEMGETMRAMTSADASPQDRATRQADLLKRAYERTLANAKELGEMIQKANTEAMHVLNARVSEAMGEVKALMDKSAGKAG